MDVLVMEYLFYCKNTKQVWDLKGSLRNRYASTTKSETPVLLDENLVEDLWGNQLYVSSFVLFNFFRFMLIQKLH